jgi:methionyl-tRNA synthetase
MTPRQAFGGRPVIVIDTPPTPNGSLHVGHFAGPFIAADVHARYLRLTGRRVIFSTGTDDSQTYVLASARKAGIAPEDLCGRSAVSIRRALEVMGISIDGFAPYDDGYRRTVLDFAGELHAAGRFKLRTVALPYSERTGEFLVEGLVSGDCPVCLAESRGGLCETCGHPNNFDELIGARATADPTDLLTTREARVLVLPMEEYREQITAYYAGRLHTMRSHAAQQVREILARPLPDFPVTYPLSWGIPAPFPETPGQVLNAWLEGIPAVMYCTARAAANLGAEPADAARTWEADRGHELVYFIGFDNLWFWGFTHLALILAHEGRYIVPDAIVVNEFYELENEKFSTSRGHVLYSEDLVSEVPRDLVRFYLSIANPEGQQTNFSRAALDQVTRQRLVEPWNEIGARLGKAVAEAGLTGAALPVSDSGRANAAIMADRFGRFYQAGAFSLTRAAGLLAAQLERLRQRLRELDGQPAEPGRLGDLFLEVRALIAVASPILIDLASAAEAAGAFDGTLGARMLGARSIVPFAVPALTGIAEPAGVSRS